MFASFRRALGAAVAGFAFMAGLASAEAPMPSVTATPAPAADTASPKEDIHPAIWSIKKENGATITLFGSVHLLPDGKNWRIPALVSAYKNADVIVLETNLADMQTPELMSYMTENALNPTGVTLTQLLTPEQKEIVSKGAEAAGTNFAMLDGFRPWLVAMQLSVAVAVQQGFMPDQGVDQQIQQDAQKDGKAFDYFEKAKEQIDFFIDMPEKLQIGFLVSGSKEIVEKPDALKKLVDAWSKGDVALIDKLMNEGASETPEVGKILLENRNQAWVSKILSFYMKDKNSYLIVVGAGHLAGEKGVPAMLRAEGVKVEGP